MSRNIDKSNMTPEEIDYYSVINESAEKVINRYIRNSLIGHAIYLANTLIDFANKSIEIYSGNLARTRMDDNNVQIDVYDDVQLLSSLSFFLQTDKSLLTIVLEDDADGGIEDHPVIKLVRQLTADDKMKGRFLIKKLHSDSLQVLEDKDMDRHFIVVDKTAYRVEDPKKECLGNECKAFANFNDSGVAKGLSEFFHDFLLKNSSEISI